MSNNGNGATPVGAALVVGGGIAGIQAALDLAEAGIKVYLIEKSTAIGGRMAQLDKTFPTNDCAMCTLAPKLTECSRHPNIELLTNAEVVGLTGEPGHFQATVLRRPRFIDLDRCTGCGECVPVCPISVANEFNWGLDQRKAIYRLYPQAAPGAFAIEKKGTSPCRVACPAHQRAQGYIALIRERHYKEAMRAILEDNPFPGTCGRICNKRCEKACNRRLVDEAVAICALKRFVADTVWAMPQEPIAPPPRTRPERVAIVGAGPAGLTAAQDLVRLGYGVTVYEALPVAGGMVRVGVPEFRLPRWVIQREVDDIVALGVELKLNCALGRDFTLEKLFQEGYKAVFLAMGAHRSMRLGAEGEDAQGVVGAIEFLREAALGQRTSVPERVVVVGGGNTAIDAARTAARLGAKEVTLAYRRSRAEMPADESEIVAAEEEGIKMFWQVAPVKVAVDGDNRVRGLVCLRTELGEPDQSGRRRPIPIPGSEFTLPVGLIVAAISQTLDPQGLPPELALDKNGTIIADRKTLMTSIPGVFAGGDAVTGTRFVIDAVDFGHRAAQSIHRYLSGEKAPGFEDEEVKTVRYTPAQIVQMLERGEVKKQPRAEIAALPPQERTADFREVELCLTEEQALAEAERCLQCGVCSECLECVYACQRQAVNHYHRSRRQELEVGAVIVAAGYTPYDARAAAELGFGRYPNVVTGPQFERLLSASGPTAGQVRRPSDNKEPHKIAFLQCIGSRDQKHPYCSAVCCMYATKEAMLAKEHDPKVQIKIFQIDMRAFSKGFEAYFRRARDQGIEYIRCRISALKEVPGTQNILVRYWAEEGQLKEEQFDLVVLAVGLEPNPGALALAKTMGLEADESGFYRTLSLDPLQSTRPGVFVCGTCREPKDIPDSVIEASGAAAAALRLLSPARGTLVQEKTYPPEIALDKDEPRIGVFVCHCGNNIAGVVDVRAVAEFARQLPNVVHAEQMLYACSADALETIRQRIPQHRLNRVVVASCTPRTHEPLFQDTIREAGLNPYLFEMANIRDQCSWVHAQQPAEATEKAKALVKMAVARARLLEPLHKLPLGLKHSALVIGGGVAGMSAAIGLAEQGFQVYLVEREGELGGRLRELVADPEADGKLRTLRERVERNPLIEVLNNTQVVETKGFVGNFRTTVESTDKPTRRLLEHGVTIVATGAREYRGPDYGLGQDPRVMTQTDLEIKLGRSPEQVAQAQNIVMLQCVGPWGKVPFYCSRICCTVAIKNALRIKNLNPQANISIVYYHMRTYGFKEKLYTEAREKGVFFLRCGEEEHPRVESAAGRLVVSFREAVLKVPLRLPADLVVLSTALVAPEGATALGQILKVPLTAEGFFLEAHIKLRPVDFASEGLFLCGSAHYPKFLDESVAQGLAAASRAGAILTKEALKVGGVVAQVTAELCAACLTCLRVCPYNAPFINAQGVAEIAAAACQGCGICAAECPAKAIQLMHYKDDQVMIKAEALLVGV